MLENHVKTSEETARHNLEVVRNAQGELKFDKVILFLTPYCNLNCFGCYTHTDPQSTEDRLFFYEDIMPILKYAKDKNVSGLIIPGKGEPVADPEFWRVMEYSSGRGLNTVVYTNGTMIDRNGADKLFRLGIDVIVKMFSLDEQIHDRIARVNGAYRLMRYGLNALLEAGYKGTRIGIDTYIIRTNLEGIPDLLRFCRREQILPYFESFLLPNPKRKIEVEDEIITSEELTKLFEELRRIDKREFGINTKLRKGQRVYCSSPTQEYETPVCKIDGINTCSRTFSTFSVMNNGDVRAGCVVDYKTVGNIREESLENILSVSNPRLREVFAKPCTYSTANYGG